MNFIRNINFSVGSIVTSIILLISSLMVIIYNFISRLPLYLVTLALISLICSILVLAVEIYLLKTCKENEYIVKNGIKIGGQVIGVKPLDRSNQMIELECFGLIDGQEYNFTGVVENKNSKSLLGQTVIIYVNPNDYDRYIIQTF